MKLSFAQTALVLNSYVFRAAIIHSKSTACQFLMVCLRVFHQLVKSENVTGPFAICLSSSHQKSLVKRLGGTKHTASV